MKVAFELQPLMSVMTGIGFSAFELTRNIESQKGKDFEIEGLYFNFLRRHNDKLIKESFNFPRKSIAFLPREVLLKAGRWFPFNYNNIFGSDADIFHFFASVVPPKIKGKVVLTIHDLLFLRFPEAVDEKYFKFIRNEQGKSLERADWIIAVSEFTKKEIIDFFDISPEKISVVYNGVNPEQFNSPIDTSFAKKIKKKYNLPEKYFLHVGTLQPRKNLERLVLGYNEYCRGKNKDEHLVLAGTKWHKFEPLMEKIVELDLESKVHVIGYIEEKEKPLIYKMAQALVFPSLYEGFGIPPLEAMAAGVPVAAARSSAIPEVVGEAAYLFDPYCSDEIATALEEISGNYQLRDNLIKKGHERIKKFTWRKAATQTIEIYKKLMGKGGGNG